MTVRNEKNKSLEQMQEWQGWQREQRKPFRNICTCITHAYPAFGAVDDIDGDLGPATGSQTAMSSLGIPLAGNTSSLHPEEEENSKFASLVLETVQMETSRKKLDWKTGKTGNAQGKFQVSLCVLYWEA